jgi:hypothetical protein
MGGISLALLTGVTPPVVALANGNNDLYTVPTGKRALILFSACFNTTGGNLNVYHTIKVAGTTYRIGSTTLVNLGTLGSPQAGFCFDAGDIFGINTDGAGIQASTTIYEFDATSSYLKGARILDTINGDSTLYTCPANKRAHLLLNTGLWGAGHLSYCGTSGTPNLTPYLVPSGGAKGASNQIGPTTTVSALVRNQFLVPCVLSPGDAIVVNSNAAGALICANIQEIPYG